MTGAIACPGHISSSLAVPILAVIVVYKRIPGETESLRSLEQARRSAPGLDLRTLVFDNTPGGQDPGDLPAQVEYRAMPHNPGLAEPYNLALDQANRESISWLLTLDQDTTLPPDFFVLLEKHIAVAGNLPNVAAIVPQISDLGKTISPFRFVAGFLPRITRTKDSGVAEKFTSALNSGALFRVSALTACGGYDAKFPLHNSDTRTFQSIDKAGFRVFIARDIVLQHQLGILQRQERLSPDRYRRLLEDECEFWDRHMGALGRTERLLRLFGRWLRGVLRNEDPAYRAITRKELQRRLRSSRLERIRTSKHKS